MITRARLKWVLPFVVVFMVTLAGAPVAGAQGALPPLKEPQSARYAVDGSVTIGQAVYTLKASGGQVGQEFWLDMTVMPPGGAPPIMFNQVQAGMMYYFRLGPDERWYSIDLSKTPGNIPTIQGSLPGINGFNPNGEQRTYDAISSLRETGKEVIDGAPTTRYEGPVDLVKLYTSIGASEQQAAQVAAVSRMTATLWVGDDDQYLRRSRIVLNTVAPAPSGGFQPVMVDFTLGYSDFGAMLPVPSVGPSTPYMPGAPTGGTEGQTGQTPGMPRTGAGEASLVLVMLGLSALLVITGGLLRQTRRT